MSLQTGSSGRASSPFDLNSQAGVMQLLAAVRASSLSNAQKSELRDLVFLYTNGGGDASVRLSLEQKLATYQLEPVSAGTKSATAAAAPVPPPTPPRPFGNSRPAPTFAPVAVPPPTPPAAQAHTTPPVVLPVADAVPVTPEPPRVAPPPPVPAPVVVDAQQAPAVAPAPASVPATPAPAVPVTPNAQYIDRIREIKQVVNQKVGNPVNLVDIDNAVGREYMVALLEAMKRVNGGIPGELEVAMERLESSYAAVERAIAAHEAAGAAAPAAPVVENPAPATGVVAPLPEPEPAPQPESPRAAPLPPAPTPPAPVAPRAPQPAPLTRSEVPEGAVVGYAAASLADDTERLLTPHDLPTADSVDTLEAAGDPLLTKEVDAGLDQLLSEWSIFKKSGLFGTGPKGRQHPLFKELAKLTIPLILAGRYDGSSQDIRQSVTDYMNGWRYEQGIVYQQDETFEHYLRRVIRHIIDLQKRRGSA